MLEHSPKSKANPSIPLWPSHGSHRHFDKMSQEDVIVLIIYNSNKDPGLKKDFFQNSGKRTRICPPPSSATGQQRTDCMYVARTRTPGLTGLDNPRSLATTVCSLPYPTWSSGLQTDGINSQIQSFVLSLKISLIVVFLIIPHFWFNVSKTHTIFY